MASSSSSPAVASGDLADLVASAANAAVTVHPSEDAILQVLQARFRADQPFTAVSASNLVVVNPYKALASTSDASAREYEERAYRDTSVPLQDGPRHLQPHVYDLAAKVYLMMRRRDESQAVIFRGITGSGKSSTARLLTDQILRLSSHSKRESKLAEQIKSLQPLLDSFGNAKTLANPNASRHTRFLELHFNSRGRIAGAKVLAFALDKSRLARLQHEERTYHVFYQLLAGAAPDERDRLGLEDMSDYGLLASSGCYRLPAGPFADDGIAMDDLRAAMRALGFKPKHLAAITQLLAAILTLGNLQFGEGDHKDVSAHVANPPVLEHAAGLLGVPAEDLAQILTNRTSYVRKELYTVLMDAAGARAQRDAFTRDLYAILFAFVVEHANHRVAPPQGEAPPRAQIVLLDQPGFQSRGPTAGGSMAFGGASPLVSVHGQNSFDEFTANFADELVHSYFVRNTFGDNVGYNGQLTADGISLPTIATMDNAACIELLRGAQLSERASRKPGGMIGVMSKAASNYKSGKSGDHRNEEMLQDLNAQFGVHGSFVSSPSVGGAQDRHLFGINHYAGPCSYDASQFIEKDTDIVDPSFVSLLRTSSDSFVAKLFSGPSLAAERHSKDDSIIVQAQVSSRPLRQPTPILGADGSGVVPGAEFAQLDPAKVYPVTTQVNHVASELLRHLDRARLWTVSCIRPNESGSANSFDKRRVKAQVRALLLPDLVGRRQTEYVADYEQSAFCERYVPTMRGSDAERIRQCAASNGWREGADYTLGHRSIWLTYGAWKTVEDVLRAAEKEHKNSGEGYEDEETPFADDAATDYTHPDARGPSPQEYDDSAQYAAVPRSGPGGSGPGSNGGAGYGYGGMPSPMVDKTPAYSEADDSAWGGGWDKKGGAGTPGHVVPELSKEGAMLIKDQEPKTIEQVPTSRIRRVWLWLTWALTWWIPSWSLAKIGRMKRPDIRLAWREKMTICLLILLLNATVIFYIVIFGKLLCPEFDKAWSISEVNGHTDDDNYWVAIQGWVYDVSKFVHGQHSDIPGLESNTDDVLEGLAGQDMTNYFPVPLSLACPDLVSDGTLAIQYESWSPTIPTAMHTSGSAQSAQGTQLDNDDWYTARFLPKIKQYRKGPLVIESKKIKAEATNSTSERIWASYKKEIFDLTDLIYSISLASGGSSPYDFLDTDVLDVFKQQAGQDITDDLNKVFDTKEADIVAQNLQCLRNAFFVGKVDFRKGARCQVQNYLLIVASAILMASMVVKFLAALQLSPKRNPELLDKFVICQIPCYTEGEDSLRRTIDSLSALNYDDKRKLLFVICDGNIIGSGNDRTTPRIVLDILGVDPKLDPEPLMFKSVGEGSKAINYAKIYSGLYEFEGHIVPYMVVVKVGKPTERSKPGNRGKRDSQILVMHYLNRVHFDAPMSPMELEIYHQMRNVIGIDPAFYEYIFTVDADTTVTPESLNRLVASAADDSSIIGICGETRLENEEGSWWTMIQVYEYYISHHLSKAFESLFGSVTCLPGCFSLYRIRTADKGRPIIISNRIIEEYSEPLVDTLHKKNLFSLGEDRYLTTLMMKHFPTFKTKFIPDATAHTVAPESWRVLLSQRRRWINSTVHNLCELVMLPELFGFCCFSMRFFVFIDLLGTLILPATVVYLIYLIITVSTGNAPIPIISLAMIAATYGLQALIFILKREFMLVGWMVVYIISYPVYSFFLPVYSFWCMDEFGWGNTRQVIGEGKDKKVIINDDDKMDESMIPLKKFSEYEAEAWESGSRHSPDGSQYSRSRSHSRAPGSRSHSPGGGYAQSQNGGDYYRDTNRLAPNNTGGSRLRSQGSQGNLSQYGGQQAPSQFAAPQLPFMPFAGGPGSAAGSDYGGQMPMAAMPFQQPGGGMYGMMMPQHSGSMYQMPAQPVMGSGMSMFGPDASQSAFGGAPPSVGGFGMAQRPMSTFSMATSVNPFAVPSQNENPTDDELFNALRLYLSTQDLMTVTKKTAREAISLKFPRADLSSRKEFLSQSIDKILSQS